MLKLKYIVIGLIIILISGAVYALEVPQEERTCYKWGTTEGLFMCFVSLDGTYAKWFPSYTDMNQYYTPQLKEIVVTGGETQSMTVQKKGSLVVGTMTVTGSPSYLYVKHT